MKLYTFVVHYLQMCMKEYGCCPKFKRGDNSTYTFMKRGCTKKIIFFIMAAIFDRGRAVRYSFIYKY
jgi:hypothetical protein